METGQPIIIEHSDHPGQALVSASKARTRVIAAGRRWGKTRLAAVEILREHGRRKQMEKPRPFRAWCVAPSFALAMETWREFFELVPMEMIRKVSEEQHRVELVDGSILEWRSTDDEKQLRGAGLDFVVVDEAARVSRAAWVALLPCVMDQEGRILLISTPKGMNWFYDQWLQGQDKGKVKAHSHESWRSSSSVNPYLKAAMVEAVGAELEGLDPRTRTQELEAEFLEDMGQVFRNIQACAVGRFQNPGLGPYVMGLDLARTNDYTVACVVDVKARAVVAWDRFSRVAWPTVIARAVRQAQKYNAMIIADATGLGEPVVEAIREQWSQTRSIVFSSSTKAELVTNLSMLMEAGQLVFPPIAELIMELTDYGCERLPGGGMAYHAPEGRNDDCVTALMLAAWALRTNTGQMPVVTSRIRRVV